MAIYTRTGDKGETGLASGQRISKASPVIDFIGDLDELNSMLGVCIAMLGDEEDYDFDAEIEVLEEIQNDLFVVGAIAAGSKKSFDSIQEVSNIEETIDDYEKLLPKLHNFILPGGSLVAANIHYARSLVRELERKLVSLKSDSIAPFIPYLNRLSDLLFVMARYVNREMGFKETIWKS